MTKHKIFFGHKASRAILTAIVAGSLIVGATSTAVAGSREQAKRMHDRLAGIPPSNEMLCAMEYLIDPARGNDPMQAAYLVMSLNPAADANVPGFTNIPAGCGTVDNSASRKAFYSVSLKDYFTPWTNAARSKYGALNDMTATLIGMVRDGEPFTTALYEDIVYIDVRSGADTSPGNFNDTNGHYETLESDNADLSDSSVLAKRTQTAMGMAGEGAGMFTTRAAGKAFFSAGTNRRVMDYMMFNFICNGLLSSAAELKDPTRSADRITKDVSRGPGGDSAIYLNNCIGCHAGMDPFRGALAYYDWDDLGDVDPENKTGRVVYTSGTVQPKYLQNATVFPAGYVNTDDEWLNYWREGSNERLEWGWDTSTGAEPNQNAATDTDRVTSGNGAKSFGQEIASTKAFAQCQVARAYEHACLQPPVAAHQATLDGLVEAFKTTGNHSVRWIFANVAPLCMGD